MGFSGEIIKRESWLAKLVQGKKIITPSLIFDTRELDRILSLFHRHLPKAGIFYAFKANQSPSIAKYFADRGLSFDVASEQEVKEVKAVGISPKRFIFSNPVKSVTTIQTIFSEQIPYVSVDNPGDIAALAREQFRSRVLRPVGVFARVRVPSKNVEIDLNEKFGSSEDEAVECLRLARDQGLAPCGVQFHVGTQSWDVANFAKGVGIALRISKAARDKYGINCTAVNIGGGFPDVEVADKAGGIESFFKNLEGVLAPLFDSGLNVMAEPGRVLVSGAASCVCAVVGRNMRGNTPWLYLDDGAYGLYSGKYFDHKTFKFSLIAKSSGLFPVNVKTQNFTIAGPTCDSIDIVEREVELPENMECGDVLCSHNMGAYSVSTANRFNGFGIIDVALGDGESMNLITDSDVVGKVLKAAN